MLRALVLLTCSLTFVACGNGDDGEAPGVRVRLLTSEADGAITGTLLLESTAGEHEVYEAQPTADDPDVFESLEAKPGTYYVRTSTGWGMLWVGSGGPGAPFLRGSSHPATTVRMGTPRTLYVAANDPRTIHGHVTDHWGADWKVAGTGDKRVEALRLADIFRARPVDTTTESFIFEITGPPDKIDSFIALMRELGLVSVGRSGVVGMMRGAGNS